MSIRPISSTELVDALVRAGFIVYRSNESGTILERQARAVVVPTRSALPTEVSDEIRRMAGIPLQQLDALLAVEP